MSEPFSGLRELMDKQKEKHLKDAEKFKSLDEDLCMICHARGEDKRSWFLDCFYAVDEAIPEALCLSKVYSMPGEPPEEASARRFGDVHRNGFYLRLCKVCRGTFLEALKKAADERRALRDVPKDHDGHLEEADPERNIPVRDMGQIKMLTRAEWDERMLLRQALGERNDQE